MSDVTIYDVAKHAGVSISTVSRVLNSPEQVNAKTRARVLTSIDELHFVPKAEAVGRARKQIGRIGVLAPFFTYPSFVQRLRGLAKRLVTSPYEMVIYNVDSTAHRDSYLASLPITKRLDGLIIMSLPFDETVAERLTTHQLPTILIEHAHESFSSIEIDHVAGGRLAAQHLLARGHHRCAFIGDASVPDYAIHTSALRLTGYRDVLQDAGIALPDYYIALGPHGLAEAQQLAHQLFDLPEPPTAIFAPSDNQAMGVLKAARERGIAVPQELAVIGFDDLDIADYIGLTTIRQPLEESGQVAIELLLSRLNDQSRLIQHIKLPLTVIQRETT